MPLNKCGLPRYHFRRIGPPATLPEVEDVMDFNVKTTLIGRNRGQMTYYISSKREENRKYISRSHARVVRSASNQHKLIDSSMNGMFVNDVKIEGPTILEEGDTVTFGHPNGQNLPPATRVRQPDSEYQFVFELCDCSDGNQSNDNSPQQLPMVARNQSCCSNANAVFQVPAAVPLRKPNRDASPLVHIGNRPEEIKPQSRDCPAAGSDSCQLERGDQQLTESGDLVTRPRNTQSASITAAKTENNQREVHISGPSFEETDQGCKETSVFALRPEEDQNEQSVIHDSESQVIESDGTGDQPTGNGEKDIENSGTDPKTGLCAEGMAENELPESTETTQKAEVITSAQLRKAENASHTTETKETRDQLTSAKKTHVAKDVSAETSNKKIETESTEKAENAKCLPLKSTGFEKRSGLPKLTNCEMSADDVQDGFQKQNVIPGNPDLDLENKENETVVFSTAVVIDSPGKDNSSTEDDQTVGILHERGKRENTQCDQHVAVHSQELVKDDKDRDTAQEITLHRLPVVIDVPPQILPTKQHDDEHFNINRNNNHTNVSQERATVRQRVSGGACSQSTSKQDVADATKLCSTCEGELSETASQGNTCRANDAGEESCNVPTGRTAKETEKGGEIPVDSKACEDQHQLTKNTNHSDTTDNPLPQTGVECGSVQLMNEEQEPAIKPQKMGFEINFSGLDSPDSSDVETALVLTDGRKSTERNSVTDHVFDSAFGNDKDIDRESHDRKIQEISDVEVGNSDKSDDDVPSDDVNDSVVLEVPPQKYISKYKERSDDLSVDSDKESWVSSSVVEEEEQQQGRSDAGSSRGDESDAESYVTSSSVDGEEPRWMASDSLEFDVMDTGEGGSGYRNDLDVIEEEGAEESEDSKDDEEMVSDAESGEDSEIGQMADEEESGCLEQQSVTDKDVQMCGSEEMSESAVCEVKDMKVDSEENRADPGSCQSEKSDVESEVKPESNHPFADQVNGGNDKVNENEIDDEKASDNSESTTDKAEERKSDQVVHEVTTEFELGEGEKAEGAHEKSMMSSTPHKEYSVDRETNQDAVTPSIERDNNFEAELRSKHTIVGKMILEAGEKEGSQTSSRSSTPLLDMPASQDSINHHDVSSIVSEEDLALVLETQSDTEDSPAGKSQTSDGSSEKYESPAKRILMYGSHMLLQDGGQLSDEIREVLQNSDNQDALSEKQGEEEEGKVVIPEVIDLVGKAVEEGQCTLDASFQDVAKESSHFQSLCMSKHEHNVKHLDSTESFPKRLSTEIGSSETVQVDSDHGCAGDMEDDQQLEDHRQQMPGTSRSETCTIEATVPTEAVNEDQVPEVLAIGMANEKEEDKADTVNDKTCESSEAEEELKSDVYSSGDGPQKIDEESRENNYPEEMKSEAATLTTQANCEMGQQATEAVEADVKPDANDHEERIERSKEKVECKVDELKETLTEDGSLQGVTDNDKEGSNDGHGNDQSGLIHISCGDIKGQIVNERVINGEVGVESSMSSKMNEEPQIKSKDEVELGDDFSEHSHTENGEQQGANQDTHCINKDEISENIETGKFSTLSGSKGEKLQREDSIAHDSNKDGKCPELEEVKEIGVADSIATPEVFEGQCGDRIAKTEDDEDVTIAPATEDHALEHNVCVQQKSIDDNLSSTILEPEDPVERHTIKTKYEVSDDSKSVEDEPMETEMTKIIDAEENQTEKGGKGDETEMSEIAMDTNEDTSTRMANLQHTSDGVQQISAGGNTTGETTQMERETATGSQTSLLNGKERSNNSMRTDVSVDDIQKKVYSDCENFNGHEAMPYEAKVGLQTTCLKFSKSKERIPQEKGKVKQVTQRGHDQGGKYCVQKLADVSQSYFVGYLVREFFKRLSHSPDLLNHFIVLHREEGIRRYVRDFFNEMNGTDQRAVIGSEVDMYAVKDSSGPSESVTGRIDDDVTVKNDKETVSANAAEERADSEMQILGDDESNIESVQRVETPESFVSCELSNERSTEVRAEVVETDIEMEQYYDCTEEIEESGMVWITQDDDKLEKNMIDFREVKSPYKGGLITSDEDRKDESSKHADIPDTRKEMRQVSQRDFVSIDSEGKTAKDVIIPSHSGSDSVTNNQNSPDAWRANQKSSDSARANQKTEDDISAKQSVSTDVTRTKLNTFDDSRTNHKDSDDITAKQESVGDMSKCQQAVKSDGAHVNTSKDKPNQETTDKCESTGEREPDVKEYLHVDDGVEKQDGCIKSSIHEENSQSSSCCVEKEDDSTVQNSINKSGICNQDFSRLMSPHKAVSEISRRRDEYPVEKNETQNRYSVSEKSKSSMVVAPCRPQSDILDDSSTAAGSRSDEGSSECKNESKASERINREKNGSDPAKGADQRSGDMAVNGSSDENVTVSEHKSESSQESTFSPIQPFTSVSPIESGNSKRPLSDDEASDGEVATSVSQTAKKRKTDSEVMEEHSGAHSLGVSHRFKVTCSFDEDSISDFSSPLVDFNALESDHEGDGGKSDSSEKQIKAGKNGSQNGVTESDINQNCISDVSQKQPKAMCREPDVSIDRVVPTDVCNMSSDSTDGNDNSTKIKPANQISLDSNQPRCTKLSPNHNKKDCDKGESLWQKSAYKESITEGDMAEEKESRESKDNDGSNHSEDVAAGIDVDDGDGSSDEENDDGIGDDGGFYDESDEDDNNYDADNHSDGADDNSSSSSSSAVASDTDDSEDEDEDDFDRRPPKLMNNLFRDSNFDDGDDSEDSDDEEKQPPLLINELCKDITTDDSDDSIGELSDPFSKVKVNGHRSKSSKTSEEPPMLPIATKRKPTSSPTVSGKRKPTSSPTVSGKRKKICTEENSDISSAESSPKKTEQPSNSKVSEVAGKVAKALGQAKDSEVVQRFRKHALLKEESDKKTPGSLLPTSHTKRRLLPNASNVTLQNIDRHLSNCNNVLKELEVTLNGCDNLNCVTTVNKWKDELKELQQKKTLPKTVIAVVGDTGAGKSSLMNALLDEEAVLPTSGMRACTAVVVEIINNESSSRYEAEIEFLSKKEWDDELKLLLNDLIDADGKVKSRPDPKSDAGIAYCKVRDVYGKIASYTELQGLRNVTRKLGTVEKISCLRPREFRRQIDRYIDSNDDDAKGSRSGGKFWPIVKRVKVKIPNCDVCSSGAVLVDLPGVRDSNAARDNIAKQYLKTCTAVWVVADITRAVDNKTAKDLLGESFRRQLLMDGQYGSVAFICTKNDLINPSEIIRALHLGEQCEAIESEIDKIRVTMQPLQEEKELLDDRKEDVEAEIESVRDDVNDLKKEILDLRKIVEPVDLNLEEEDDESEECSEERRQLEELKEELQEKRHYIKEKQNTLEEIAKLTADKIKEMLPFEKAIEKKQMKLRELCAKARNEFAKTQIKRDFKAGLKEMKKKAGLLPEDADIEDDEEEDEFVYDSDDDDDEIVRTADKLKVFTVSSTEYLKLKDKLTRDGPPQVFSSIEDTQIPAIKRFVHDITCTRRLQGTERLIRSIGRYQEDLLSYLTDEGTESKRARTSAKFTFDSHLGMLQKNLKPILNTLESDIDEAFDGCISPKLRDGVNAAKESCIAIQMKWGSKVNKENRSVGGLHWATYKATVKRNGAYNSATAGPIDFNQDLSEPMYSSIMIQWDKVFSGVLMRTLDSCIHSILGTLKRFFLNLQRELQALGIALDRITRVSQQQLDSAAIKLKSAVGELKVWIQDSQRDINRLIPPSIQSYMEPVYNTCTNESGSGSFARMKGHMERHVVVESSVMFDAASTTMLEQLMVLQQEIVARFRAACETICENIALHYQPFWDLPTKTKALRESMLPGILRSSEMVKALYKDAKIVELKENLLDNKPAGSATVSSDSKPTGDCKPGGQVTPVQQQTITVPGSSGSGVSSEPRRQEVIHSKPPDTAQQYHAHNSNQVPKGFSQYGAVLNSFNVKPSGVSVPGSGPSSTVHRAPLNSILSIQNHIKTQGVQYKSGIKLEHAQVSGTQITGPTSSTKTQGKPANYSQPYHIPCMPGQQSVRKPSPSKYTAFQLPGSNTGRIAAIEMPMKPSSIQQVPLHPLAGKLIRLESPASPAVLQQLRNQGCVILPPQQAVQVKTPSVQNLTPSQNTAGTAASRVTTGLYAMPHKPVTVKREPAIHTGTSSAARTSRTTTSTTTTSSNRNTNNYSSIKVKQEPGCIPSTSTGKKKYRSKIVDYVDLTQDSSDDDTYQPPLKKKKDKDDMKRYKKYH